MSLFNFHVCQHRHCENLHQSTQHTHTQTHAHTHTRTHTVSDILWSRWYWHWVSVRPHTAGGHASHGQDIRTDASTALQGSSSGPFQELHADLVPDPHRVCPSLALHSPSHPTDPQPPLLDAHLRGQGPHPSLWVRLWLHRNSWATRPSLFSRAITGEGPWEDCHSGRNWTDCDGTPHSLFPQLLSSPCPSPGGVGHVGQLPGRQVHCLRGHRCPTPLSPPQQGQPLWFWSLIT